MIQNKCSNSSLTFSFFESHGSICFHKLITPVQLGAAATLSLLTSTFSFCYFFFYPFPFTFSFFFCPFFIKTSLLNLFSKINHSSPTWCCSNSLTFNLYFYQFLFNFCFIFFLSPFTLTFPFIFFS